MEQPVEEGANSKPIPLAQEGLCTPSESHHLHPPPHRWPRHQSICAHLQQTHRWVIY